MSLQRSFQRFVQSLEQSSPQRKVDAVSTLYSFKAKQSSYIQNSIQVALQDMRKAAWQMAVAPQGKEKHLLQLLILLEQLPAMEKEVMKSHVPVLQQLIQSLPELQKPMPRFALPAMPLDIQSDMTADLSELEKSFTAQCYRSCIILCGRILETALHRKYFEATGNDLLEKSPGIGLGNLIAKMKEKNIQLDPALMQQIHLINQVRIFSVHRKQETFHPSKEQAHAIILYTLDVLKRLF